MWKILENVPDSRLGLLAKVATLIVILFDYSFIDKNSCRNYGNM